MTAFAPFFSESVLTLTSVVLDILWTFSKGFKKDNKSQFYQVQVIFMVFAQKGGAIQKWVLLVI